MSHSPTISTHPIRSGLRHRSLPVPLPSGHGMQRHSQLLGLSCRRQGIKDLRGVGGFSDPFPTLLDRNVIYGYLWVTTQARAIIFPNLVLDFPWGYLIASSILGLHL